MTIHESSQGDSFPCRSCGTIWSEEAGAQPDFVCEECRHTIGDEHARQRCRTCNAAIVVSINDSNFNEGECGECEYSRYQSQPGLLRACRDAFWHLTDDAPENWESDAANVLRSAIAEAEEGRS
jgi:predicted RNA-binding Zn-ribbon protein involved in translation (DUF1610 family)